MDDKAKERFFSKTKLDTEIRPGMSTPCLEWTAGKDKDGYGLFWLDGKMIGAHRVAREMKHGPIPDGFCALHKCDNSPCVADEHLFLGTHAENMADRDAKGRNVAVCGDANGARLHPERLARGDANGRVKLTEENVRFIFELRSNDWTQQRIANEFGVTQVQIGLILSRKSWAHVNLEQP